MQPGSSGSSQGESSEPGYDEDDVSIPMTPSSKALSPYTPQSASEDKILQELIHHYAIVVLDNSVTVPGPRNEWFPFATSQPSFFHAAMGSSSSHLAYKRNEDGDNVGYFYHRGQAISLVNRAISDGTAANEGIIATVAAFLQQDALAASTQATKLHQNGMARLVQMVGGIDSPALRPVVRKLVLLCDLAASICLMQEPQLESKLLLPDLAVYFRQPSTSTFENANALGTRLFNFTELRSLSDDSANIYWGLRNLTEILEGYKAGTESIDSPKDGIQFTDRVEVLERGTHALWRSTTKDPQPAIFRFFGSAAVIYIYTVLREFPPELRMLKLVARRIKDQMEKSPNLNVLFATFPELMLWIFFQAGQVAEVPRKPFFAQQASKILLMRKIENQDAILKAAQDFLWPERGSVEELGDLDSSMKYETISEMSSTTPIPVISP